MISPRFVVGALLLVLLTLALAQEEAQTCTDESCSCFDEHQDCLMWAQKGECTKNQAFMKASCAMSCELCTGGKLGDWENKECLDLHPKCGEWSGQGECINNPGYMTQGCKRSCLTCINVKQEREDGMDEDEV
jgi:hypothetical protein